MARLIVLCGLPGSGKTRTAKRIVVARGGVRMCPDDWMGTLGIDLWDETVRARIEGLQWLLTQDLLGAGVDVVIEWGTWAREERDVLRAWCREHEVAASLVHLDVPRDELWRRLDVRNRLDGAIVVPEATLDEWCSRIFQAPTEDELARYDPYMLPAWTTRPWRDDDEPFLWEMLYESIHVPDGRPPVPRSVLDDHAIAHYLTGFGTHPGDDAEIVVDERGGRVAAAFCRRMNADDPGYGFVRDEVPEVGMAVAAGQRGIGLGRLVLTALLQRHPTMSLSVDRDNTTARRFYESLGFVEVGDDGNSATMLREPTLVSEVPS